MSAELTTSQHHVHELLIQTRLISGEPHRYHMLPRLLFYDLQPHCVFKETKTHTSHSLSDNPDTLYSAEIINDYADTSALAARESRNSQSGSRYCCLESLTFSQLRPSKP
ncbi:hypothetical protein ILYODFUR_011927 [Ilyodon furcidens]|uniref:Uncharacterized protein n=1 Tax=Ilyodon furcidens TaxID=33524 RepID=A0ABV0SW96_9TELE